MNSNDKVTQTKDRIVSIIKLKGPSLPVQIARLSGLEPLFASAFLSELYNEEKIKISNMRIGSSPLYYISGQEELLENFSQYLNQREKEALSLLKNKKILEDEKQSPVIRVALRAIKDFAVPIRTKINNEEKTIWKYFLVQNSELKQILDSKEQTVKSPEPIQPAQQLSQPIEKKQEIEQPAISQEHAEKIEKPQKKRQKPRQIEQSNFTLKIKEHLSSKQIEIFDIIIEKKKEFIAKIRIGSMFGKQEYYLTAKDKKRISETDLTIAHQKAQSEKMIALLISPGDPDKKASEYLQIWKNLIKFEKI